MAGQPIDALYVSIHAPVWGATLSTAAVEMIKPVSIHAPVWGATQWQQLGGKGSPCFNPRPRVGGDVIRNELYRLDGVSIHAPVWGATAGPARPLATR